LYYTTTHQSYIDTISIKWRMNNNIYKNFEKIIKIQVLLLVDRTIVSLKVNRYNISNFQAWVLFFSKPVDNSVAILKVCFSMTFTILLSLSQKVKEESINTLMSGIYVIPYKSRPNLFNRSCQILLNLRYVVEGRVLWILTQTVYNNIELSISYEHFMKSSKSDHIDQRGS
jgi:hypothetical protein